MDIRDSRGTDTEGAPPVVVAPGTELADDRPVLVPDSVRADDRPVLVPGPGPDPSAAAAPAPPRGRSGRRLVLVGALVLVALVVAVAAWLLQRGGDATVATTAPPAAKPAAPAGPTPLTVRVDVPGQVVAGRPATLVVHYADGAGIFSGSTEDWGDQVGTSSVSEAACPTGAAAAAPALSSSYAPRHTWSKPGTYPVTVGVSTYTCVNGAAVQEQASTTLQVVVAAP